MLFTSFDRRYDLYLDLSLPLSERLNLISATTAKLQKGSGARHPRAPDNLATKI